MIHLLAGLLITYYVIMFVKHGNDKDGNDKSCANDVACYLIDIVTLEYGNITLMLHIPLLIVLLVFLAIYTIVMFKLDTLATVRNAIIRYYDNYKYLTSNMFVEIDKPSDGRHIVIDKINPFLNKVEYHYGTFGYSHSVIFSSTINDMVEYILIYKEIRKELEKREKILQLIRDITDVSIKFIPIIRKVV